MTANPNPPDQPTRRSRPWPFQDTDDPEPADPAATQLAAAAPTTLTPAAPRRPRRGCLQLLGYSLVALFFAGLLVVIALTYGYWSIARDLPPIGDLRARASQFETARIYDAKGNLLSDIVDPNNGRRTRVPLSQISPNLIAATLATEDQNFFQHPGFDPIGIARAIWQNLRAGDTVSGASTITQQLVRALVFTPEEAAQQTTLRKIREIILSAEITRQYSKDEILELYLNEIYYGNRAYGIEAAAETYFNKSARDLTLSEAAMLAGLPQAPAVYDIFTRPPAVYNRQRDVLTLMLADSQAHDCIAIQAGSGAATKVCINDQAVGQALADLRQRSFTPPVSGARFPHWVNYVRQLVETRFGAQALYRSGYNIYTTLEPDQQVLAEKAVAEQVAGLAQRNVTNGALVALRPATGEIVVMVGSHDYRDPKDGQINMALVARQPGSSIKPLTFALAFERGWNPATLLWDVPTEFPDGANPPYVPVNYDGKFHGPVLARYALANSYNIPAVKALQYVSIYGGAAPAAAVDGVQSTAPGALPTPTPAAPAVDPHSGLIPFLQSLGVTTLDRNDYGLALTLGGGEVPLLQMVGAYGALADGGRRVFPVAIHKVTDAAGRVVCQQPLTPVEVVADPPPCQAPPADWGRPVMTAGTAYLISDILADNDARTPAFGPNSPLHLAFPAAVKTGTTNDFRDNWTIGYTPELVAGVWVGNADFTPMEHSTGVTGAAPIWKVFMEQALAGRATPFTRPADLVEQEICAVSGASPSEYCPADQRRKERFAPDRLPPPPERDLWQKAYVDPFTGLRQTAECSQAYQNDQLYQQERAVIAVSDPFAQKWLTEDPAGQAWAARLGFFTPLVWAPARECTLKDPRPLLGFSAPVENAVLVPGPLQIIGQAAASADFDHYRIEYGLSHDPEGWGVIVENAPAPVTGAGRLADWDTSALPDGPVTLRVLVSAKGGGSAEARVHFMLQRPTPTPAPTDTPAPTETPLPTATAVILPTLPPATSTAPPTATALPLAIATTVPATATLAPSDTPAAPTETPTPLPSATAAPSATP